MNLVDPVFDDEYFPRLESALYDIYYKYNYQSDKTKWALKHTLEFLAQLKMIWGNFGNLQYRKRAFVLKIENEVSAFKLKKSRNPVYADFFVTYKAIYLDFISDLKNELQPIPQELKVSFSSKRLLTFNVTLIPEVLKLLGTYFPAEHFDELKRTFESGCNSDEVLLFTENGNKLIDFFKRLYDNTIITGCQKKDLEKWICRNFIYKYKGRETRFKESYVHKIISGQFNPCKSNIVEIRNDPDGLKIYAVERKVKEMGRKVVDF